MSFSGDNAYRYLHKMAVEIGSRPSGSESEKRAAEWILSEFQHLGLNAHLDEFDAINGRVISKKLEVLEPYQEELGCEASPLSGSTPPDGVTGELLYLDSYDEECLTESVEGKVVLTSWQPPQQGCGHEDPDEVQAPSSHRHRVEPEADG